MELTLNTLEQTGSFGGAPAEREITWTTDDGKEHKATTYIRRAGCDFVESMVRTENSGRSTIADWISYSVVDKKGNQILAAGDITGASRPERGPMHPGLANALLMQILEVNGLGGVTGRANQK